VALELAGGQSVRLSELSPMGVAVWCKALGVVKYLLERFQGGQGLKEYFQVGSYTVAGGKATFSNLILPIILKNKDIDSLNYLIRQPSMPLTVQDI
jgi:hypothetical protein